MSNFSYRRNIIAKDVIIKPVNLIIDKKGNFRNCNYKTIIKIILKIERLGFGLLG